MIERQEKVELLCNQSEKMIEDSRDFSRSTGKLVEKVSTVHDVLTVKLFSITPNFVFLV